VSNSAARLRIWTLEFGPSLRVALRVVLCGVFLYAGVQKALDLPSATLAVNGYALAPDLLVHQVALGLTLLEIALGMLLLLGLFTRLAAVGAAALAALFLVVLVQAKVRGLDISCGCFGGSGTGDGVTWLDIVRDLPILAAALYLAWWPRDRFGLDRFVPRARGPATELKIGVPLVLVACIAVAALVVPGLTGALDLPQTAAPEQVTVSGTARSSPLPVGSAIPDFSAPGLYRETVSWRSYQGVPIVLVVWATWCPECREKLPEVAEVAGDFPDVRLVSIVTAARQLPGPTPERFMRSHDLSFPVALDTADGRLSDALGVQGFPTIYYVKADGTVSRVTVGGVPEEMLRPEIRRIAGVGR
jgi:uncharacterized membrane protein YphA (DoxX/SURF4 family)/thiol-disulfide isomerase/thioredoxin